MRRARTRAQYPERVSQHRRARSTGSHHPAPGTQEGRESTFWRAALIVLAVVVVYWNSLPAPFIFDDHLSIIENPAIRSLSAATSQPHDTPLAGRPVAGLSFALNFAASGLDATAYRATNVVIHAACALLVFGIARRTLRLPRFEAVFAPKAADLAFATALIWAVHPLTTDAVTYITQRTESLMALFYLLTLYAALRAHISPYRSRWEALSVCACALGMGCKESMVTAPLAVLLFDRIFLFESIGDAVRGRGRFYLALAFTWVLLAIELAPGPRANSVGFDAGVSVWTYLLNQAVVIARYLRLAFWPVDLVITYGAPVSYAVFDVLPHAAVIVVLGLATLAAFRWNSPAAFLGAWFFITLAPSSSFVPIATEVGAERRMYLPLISIVAAVVVAVHAWSGRRYASRWLGMTCLIGIVALESGATIRRNMEHQSWLTLAQTSLERWPSDAANAGVGSELSRLRRENEALPFLRIGSRSDPRARYNLGIALFNLGRYWESIQELQVLVGDHPMREEVPWAHRVMGHAYLRLSEPSHAIVQLRIALTMTPGDSEAKRLLVDAHISYGVDLAQKGKFDVAVGEFRKALKLDEHNATARYNIAVALFDSQQLDESFVEAERALALNPSNADAHHLVGKLLALQGRLKEALQSLETATKLRPDDHIIRDDLHRVIRAIR